MHTYRVYLLDKDGHVVSPPEIITCDDDDMVVQTATRLVDGHDVEIWDRDRVVARLPSHKR